MSGEELVLILVMALGSYRLWRLGGADSWPPSEALRFWLAEQRARPWELLSEWLECPWCSGSWAAALVVGIVSQLVSVPLPLLAWLAVACLVGLIGKADD